MGEDSRSSLRARLLLALGATAAALLLAEAVLHFAVPMPALATLAQVFEPVDDPELLFVASRGASHRFARKDGAEEATVTINADGARALPDGQEGCRTIWLAGDSYAFGWGVDDSETYAGRLQAAATAKLGCRPAVINLAVGGYHMGQIVAGLEQAYATRPAPAILLVHVAANDGLADINWADPTGLPRWATRRSHLLRVVNLVAVSRQYSRAEGDPGNDARLQTRLLDLAVLAEQRRTPLWWIWQPGVSPEPRLAVQGRGAGEVDLAPCNDGHSMHLGPDDDHYNVRGHRCVAELVGATLLPALESGPP